MQSSINLARALLRGERRALAKAISLVESRSPNARAHADALLDTVLAAPVRGRTAIATPAVLFEGGHTAAAGRTLRIGISGPPGAGKSTLIEALGTELVRRGHRLAVLAVDPSSTVSGGSLLGDKTRMPKLSAERNAFIRPSPASGALGGVARCTEDAILLCECAGHDRVIIETVGVGQSETDVARMVDIFLLVVPPAAGDELQGIKRGIMELADAAIVTKADGGLRAAAGQAARQLRAAFKVMRPRTSLWSPRVLEVSSLERPEGGRLAPSSDMSGRPRTAPEAVVAESDAESVGGVRRGQWGAALGAPDVADLIDEFGRIDELVSDRRREHAALAVRHHAWASLLEELMRHESEAVETMMEEAVTEAAERRLAVTQAGRRVAQRILQGLAPGSAE